MSDKGKVLAIGKKVSTIAINENKSKEDVRKEFCEIGTLEEQLKRLSNYVKEKGYKGQRTCKPKNDSVKELKPIELNANSINEIIKGEGTDSEKLKKIKDIIDKIIEREEILQLKEKIQNQKKNLELYEKQYAEIINKIR